MKKKPLGERLRAAISNSQYADFRFTYSESQSTLKAIYSADKKLNKLWDELDKLEAEVQNLCRKKR